VVTDEVSPDPEDGLRWAVEQGLDYVDLRQVYGWNVTTSQEAELCKLEKVLDKYRLPVYTICPQLFRGKLGPETMAGVRRLRADPSPAGDDQTEYGVSLRLLQHSLDLAERFGARYVRTFGFWREGDPSEAISDLVEAFSLPVEMCRRAGKILLLENEAFTCAMSGSEAAQLVQAVASPHFRVIWDPGNAFHHPERPFPEGYRAVAGLIEIIHAKDATDTGFAIPGQGKVDWDGQATALIADGFTGAVTIEPRHVAEGMTAAETCRAILDYLRPRLRANGG